MFLRNLKKNRHMWYAPDFDNTQQFALIKPKCPVLDLSGLDNRYLDISFIQTEKQLCRFIFAHWGKGIYCISAHLKGRCGIYTFWRGEINENGFVFYLREYPQNRELNKLKRELRNSNEEDKSIIYEEMEMEKLDKEITGMSRYGFYPFLKPSSRRGQFIMWDEPEIEIINKEDEKWDDNLNKDADNKDREIGFEKWE